MEFTGKRYGYFGNARRFTNIQTNIQTNTRANWILFIIASLAGFFFSPKAFALGIFSGGGNLGIQHGHYRQYDENKVPLSNLFVTMLDRLGVPVESFADSTGEMSEVLA